MASPAVSHQTGHTDTVHDVQLDYYGKRLATCSSDRTIKLFEIVGEHLQPITDLSGHEGPVWQVQPACTLLQALDGYYAVPDVAQAVFMLCRWPGPIQSLVACLPPAPLITRSFFGSSSQTGAGCR